MDKEEEITKKIEQLKLKNELLLQRHMEVEQDKKTAEKSGHSFSSKISTDASSEKKFSDKSGRSQSRAHMDNFDRKYEGRNMERHNNRGHHSSEGYYKNTPADVNRGSFRGRGTRFSDYQEKRRENFRMMEEEMAQTPTEVDDHNTSGISRFLDDPRRKGELDPEQRQQSSRHKGSYGGLEFDNIKHGMRGRGRGAHYRESRGRGRGMSRLQMSAEYTGRERQDQERWFAMREAADREIMSRSKTSQGRWRREWDSQKDNKDDVGQHDTGQSERYEEPRKTHRGGGGRGGRRGSGRGRRGTRKEVHKETNNRTLEEEHTKKTAAEGTSVNDDEIPKNEKVDVSTPAEGHGEGSKPQKTNRNNKAKSPRHLVQQRAQTPSSKDGTEVWAQNSHHSDEAGHEWKNGSSRSAEQWLPSDEGNRNPAIDERLLEQREDGATVYSRQLGRGWGNDKNIKATKAWVIDTEKAGATNQQPEEPKLHDTRGRHGNRDRANTNLKGEKHKDSRLRDVANERSEFRSASPRLRRGNPGLTVEVNRGGSRRVKHHSEGDPTFQLSETKTKTNKMNTNTEALEKESNSPKSVKSPVSAGVLKTPEGLKYVEDWALEMDIQSPTYKSRGETENLLQSNNKLSLVQEDSVKTAINSGNVKNNETSDKNSSADHVQKNLSTTLSEHKNCVDAENEDPEILVSHKNAVNSVLCGKDKTKLSPDSCEETTTATSPDQTDIETLTGIETENLLQSNNKSSSPVQEDSVKTAIKSNSVKNDEDLEKNSSADSVQKNLSPELSEHANSTEAENVDPEILVSHENAVQSVLPGKDKTKPSSDGCDETTTALSHVEASTGIETENLLQFNNKNSSPVQKDDVKTAIKSSFVKKDEAFDKNSSADSVQKELSSELSEHANSVEAENVDPEILVSHKNAVESALTGKDEIKLSPDGCEERTTATSYDQIDVGTPTEIDNELVDGTFKDAEEEVDDEFFECTGNDGGPLESATSAEASSRTDITTAENGSSKHVDLLDETCKPDIIAPANVSTEDIQVEVQETIQQHLISPQKGVKNVTSEENWVSKSGPDSCSKHNSGERVQKKDNEKAASE